MTFPRPSFAILRIGDSMHEVLHDGSPEVIKCYKIEILADGGRWVLVLDQNSRTIFQRFALN